MKCGKSRYDLLVIALNLFHFSMSGLVTGLLSYLPIKEESVKLQTVYGSLVTCMVINLGLIIAILITPASALSFNMWLRPLLSTVGAGLQLTSATFLFERYGSGSPDIDGIDQEVEMTKILASAIVLLVNSLFYVADVLFIVCFYTYHVFKDYGDY